MMDLESAEDDIATLLIDPYERHGRFDSEANLILPEWWEN